MKLIARLSLCTSLLLFFFGTSSYSQCLQTGINGATASVPCSQSCVNLAYSIPNLKSTSDYVLTTIPYTPFPFLDAAGIEDATLYDDDTYSAAYTLPFSFCFYGSTYTQAVMGSNGVITFDLLNESGYNDYNICSSIPGDGTPDGDYPAAAIMALFTDLDPRIAPFLEDGSPADRSIQWRVEGVAPCRKFIVSYYHVGLYNDDGCGLNSPTTFQIVMYESSGMIDIYYENFSCQSSTSFSCTPGNAILGIQNDTRNKAVFEAGKNPGIWTIQNEGRRFIPSGGASRFVNSQIFTLGGAFVATATTSAGAPGMLNISFPNICPPALPAKYVIRTTYNACPSGTLVSSDTVTITDGCAVPVTLLSFTGKMVGSQAQLNWKTATEVNTAQFIVEHSLNGTNFTPIGTVPAAGFSNSIKNYGLTHPDPKVGYNYYRLKTLDRDNRFSYSQVVKLSLANSGDIIVYPNPANDIITVEHPLSTEDAKIKLYDMLGRLLMVKKVEENTSQTKLKVINLPRGSYKILWSDGISTATKSLLLK